MGMRSDKSDIFAIRPTGQDIRSRALRGFAPVIERVLGLDQLNQRQVYCGRATDPQEYIRRVFETFRIRWRATPEELARIPKTGPLVVVANHPLGAIEGLVLAALLLKVRPDAKLMVNYLLGRIPNLRDIFMFVDPFGTESSVAKSLGGMRQSVKWVKDGHVLGVFPAGEVSSFNWQTRTVSDPAWNPTVARIVKMTGAPVLPVFFEGRNSLLFQALGLVHPILRTAWLPREMIGRAGQKVGLRVGSVIPARRLAEFDDDRSLIDFLRHRTYLLQHRPVPKRKKRRRRRRLIRIPLSIRRRRAMTRTPERIIDPVPRDLVQQEVASLGPEQMLVPGEEMCVYVARAEQVPNLLREVGRLREITFRATGEGTGKSIDVDSFDDFYQHLFVWHRGNREVVAAYRMGQTDRIMQQQGLRGLYTTTLFMYDAALIRRITPALEMGRSFVRAEYQRSYHPLLLLWRGICAYCAANPQYRYLFGPVSISNTYQTVSKTLMIEFLRYHHTPQGMAELVEPRNPFKVPRKLRKFDARQGYAVFETDDLSDIVADLEPDQKGIPVLLRQYLKLGAKLLAFNVDPDFGDCVDGLIVVDMLHPGLAKYFSKEGRAGYLKYHNHTDPVRPGRVAASA